MKSTNDAIEAAIAAGDRNMPEKLFLTCRNARHGIDIN